MIPAVLIDQVSNTPSRPRVTAYRLDRVAPQTRPAVAR